MNNSIRNCTAVKLLIKSSNKQPCDLQAVLVIIKLNVANWLIHGLNNYHWQSTLTLVIGEMLVLCNCHLMVIIPSVSYLSVWCSIYRWNKNYAREAFLWLSTIKTQTLDAPVGHHLILPDHYISDMILQGKMALCNHRETVRLSRKKLWIRHLQTIQFQPTMVWTSKKAMTNTFLSLPSPFPIDIPHFQSASITNYFSLPLILSFVFSTSCA